MKKYINILFLILIPCILNSQNLLESSQKMDNRNRSKQLIERFNKLRTAKNLKSFQHDTLLDNISNILINEERFKVNNTYKEDSVRLLLYKKGIIDYQYEITEFLDKDTASTYKSFLLNDLDDNLKVGFTKKNNTNILFKTKSYLKFSYGTVFCQPFDIDRRHSKSIKVDIKTDSINRYFKMMKPDKYYYQFSNRIPLNSEKLDNTQKNEIQIKKTTNENERNEVYDFSIKSTNSNMFLIISNKKNERVVVVK